MANDRDRTVNIAIEAAGSIAALASLCGVSAPAIYHWRFVPPRHMRRIAEATGLSVDALVPDRSANPKARIDRGQDL